MAKLDINLGVTVNYQAHTIDFMKMNIQVSEIDLDLPVEEQLETFDEKFTYVHSMIGQQIKEKLLERTNTI